MASDLDYLYLNQIEDDDSSIERIQRRLTVTNPLNFYDDKEFKKRFRMSKSCASILCSQIESKIKRGVFRFNTMNPMIQLLATLRVLASGTFQIIDGDLFEVTQTAISNTVRDVTNAIASLSHTMIRMPTRGESEQIKEGFRAISGMEDIIGAIDGTHIKVRAAGVSNRMRFMNRKNEYSINVQAVVDADMRFLNLVARWPGSTHDSRIFRESQLYAQLENGEIDYGILLGDGGYGCERYLLTPIGTPVTPAERRYNKAQIKTRNIIERTFGAWKRKFNILNVKIQTKLSNSLNIIVACAVIWNFLKINNDIEDEEEEDVINDETEGNAGFGSLAGNTFRQQYIQRNFN
jgi:hypothetical protein